MARRRRRKQQENPLPLLILAGGFGTFVAAVNGFWLPLIGLFAIGAAAIFITVQRRRGRRERALALADLHTLTPRGLELHVAQVINALPGWTATANRGSADQGADVIANGPKGTRVAVQVKHYPTNTVGNKAVQEIVASKAIYKCAHAIVVTSGPGYTRSARELARANGVVLWQPDDLLQLQGLAKAGQAPPKALLPS